MLLSPGNPQKIIFPDKTLDSAVKKTIVLPYLMPFPVKRTIAFFVLASLMMSGPLASAATSTGATINLPATVSPNVTRVVESAIGTGTGDTTLAQDEVTTALEKLIKIYESRVTRLQDEVNRLRLENNSLKAKNGTTTSGTGTSSTTASVAPTGPATPAAPKTEAEKKFDIIVSNIVSSFPDILKKNGITATGSIGLFEFVEPKYFFVSMDDGKNPAGVTAFKTKILFEYDANLNLKLVGLFDLDYASSKYVTVKGSNPLAGVTRIRVKNPSYNGKLLEEIVAPVAPTTPSAGNSGSTSTTPAPTTGAGTVTTAVTLSNIRKAYDKNKLGDVVQLGTAYLQSNPNNIEVLTMRARSQYIFSKFDEALNDIEAIYKIQGQGIDCGIVNDGARAEKALKGARGSVFGGLQTTKCKK